MGSIKIEIWSRFGVGVGFGVEVGVGGKVRVCVQKLQLRKRCKKDLGKRFVCVSCSPRIFALKDVYSQIRIPILHIILPKLVNKR